MEKLFLKILSMSATAVLVILAVLLARLLLRRAPKVFSYALWAVVLFRLLCPFAIQTPWSMTPSIQVESASERLPAVEIDTERAEVIIRVDDPPADGADWAPPVLAPGEEWDTGADLSTPKKVAEPSSVLIAACVWLTGAVLLLGYSVLSMLRLRQKLVGSVPLEGEENVRLADHIPSPFVLGVLRPKIYLPSDLPEGERDYILLHERTHIRRFDHIFRALAWLALSIHWFNPLVWLAFHLAGKDMEMSCDETVLRKMGRDVRADYSSSLLRLSTGKRLPAGPLAFGDGDPKNRIKNVLSYKKPALWVIIIGLVAVVCAGVALATNRGAVLDSPEPDYGLSYAINEDGTAVVMTGYEEEHAEWFWPKSDWVPEGCVCVTGVTFHSGWEDVVCYAYWSSEDRNAVKLDLLCAPLVMDYTVVVSGSEPAIIERSVRNSEDGDVLPSDEEIMELAERFAYYLQAAENWYERYTSGEVSNLGSSGIVYYEPGPALLWFDLDRPIGQESLDIQLPEFPGVTFSQPGFTAAVTEDGVQELFRGVVKNAYFCDLNGDGKRELCATLSQGSGIVVTEIVVYDYANQSFWRLADPMKRDYSLRLEGERLWAVERDYWGEADLRSGLLVMTESGLAIQTEMPASELTLSLDRYEDGSPFVRVNGSVGGVALTRGAFWHPEPSDIFGYYYPCGYLTMVYPAFTDGIEGHMMAGWTDESRTSVTLSTVMSAMLSSSFAGYWEFTVDLSSGTVTEMVPVPLWDEGVEVRMCPESISGEEAVKAARASAVLLTAAEDWYLRQQRTAVATGEYIPEFFQPERVWSWGSAADAPEGTSWDLEKWAQDYGISYRYSQRDIDDAIAAARAYLEEEWGQGEHVISFQIADVYEARRSTLHQWFMYFDRASSFFTDWTQEDMETRYIVIGAAYTCEYDHTLTPLNDGRQQMTITLTRPAGGQWSVYSTGSALGWERSGCWMEVWTATPTWLECFIGNATGKALTFGDDYRLQVEEGGDWRDVEEENPMEFPELAHVLDGSKSQILSISFPVDCGNRYGELPPGHYRILKEAALGPVGEWEPVTLSAEFDIEE